MCEAGITGVFDNFFGRKYQDGGNVYYGVSGDVFCGKDAAAYEVEFGMLD